MDRVVVSVMVRPEVDAVDLAERSAGRQRSQLVGVIEDLDPVPGAEAQHLVAAEAQDGELADEGRQRIRAGPRSR